MTVQCHVIRMVCLNRYFKIATLAQSSSTANQLIAYYCLGDYFRWGKLLTYNYLILVLVLNGKHEMMVPHDGNMMVLFGLGPSKVPSFVYKFTTVRN